MCFFSADLKPRKLFLKTHVTSACHAQQIFCVAIAHNYSKLHNLTLKSCYILPSNGQLGQTGAKHNAPYHHRSIKKKKKKRMKTKFSPVQKKVSILHKESLKILLKLGPHTYRYNTSDLPLNYLYRNRV